MILGKYNQSKTITFDLFEIDGIDLSVAATFAAGDVKIMKDEGAEANTTNLPTDEGSTYSLVLTSAEMSAARIRIILIDQTATKVWLDISIGIETYGNASAEHALDLDTASVAQTGDNYVRLGAPAGASVSADIAVVEGQTDDIGIAGAGLTNIGTIATVTNLTNLPAIPANWLTAAGIAASALNGKGDWNIGKTGYSLTQAFPANFADMAITVTVGAITIGTNNDKAGYSISGTKQTLDALNDIPATDIVSAGAITTLTGAVVNVDTVDTVTTNTDMRGTDSAALATALATAQLDLDAITDVDGVILGAAAVDLIWDEAVSGHTIGGSFGKLIKNFTDIVQLDGSISDVGPTTTDFDTDLTGYGDGYFEDTILVFTDTASNKGIGYPISGYTSVTGNFQFTAPDDWPVTPVNADSFVIYAIHVHPVSQIQAGLATEAKQDIIDTVVDAVKVKTDQMVYTKTNELDVNTKSINDAEVTGDGNANPWDGI